MRIIERETSPIKIFANTIEESALDQIKKLGNYLPYKDSKIRIMPDCHAGAGCTIGTTMTIKDKITPNLVGVDLSCGMLTVKLKEKEIDLQKLDNVVNNYIPNGYDVHKTRKAEFNFEPLIAKNLNIPRAKLSLGTLGGGNHFIEVDKSSNGDLFLVIHSGSRNIGCRVARYHQEVAISRLTDISKERNELITKLKKENRQHDISIELSKLKRPTINNDLAYLEGKDFENYLHDVKIMQEYATLNRRTIANIILSKMNLVEDESFETIHNYIDLGRMILRKGAVSAEEGEILLVPINMRDGSIIAKGKGNPDWNYSAPHGAGRLMSRTQARHELDLNIFKQEMKDIYSTSVVESTLDEAPNAYKPIEEILEYIKETVIVVDIIKPIYNFKAH